MILNLYLNSTESSVSRDRDSDDDWEEKEASRTHSVKFTEEMPEAKEVSLCCCQLLSMGSVVSFPRHAYKSLRYDVPICFHNFGANFSDRCSKARGWFRTNVRERCSRHRAYLALSSILVALE